MSCLPGTSLSGKGKHLEVRRVYEEWSLSTDQNLLQILVGHASICILARLDQGSSLVVEMQIVKDSGRCRPGVLYDKIEVDSMM